MKISNIPVGDILLFARHLFPQQKRIATLSWRKASLDNYFFSTESIGKFAADGRERENNNSRRRERGSNFFPQTNICQFLNGEGLDWYVPAHETDELAPSFQDVRGFLSEFDEWEKSILVPQTIKVAVPDGFRRQFGKQYETTLKVSLMSMSQMYGSELVADEGDWLEVFGSWPAPRTLTRSTTGSGLIEIGNVDSTINHPPFAGAAVYPIIRLDGDWEAEYEESWDRWVAVPPKEIAQETSDELRQLLL